MQTQGVDLSIAASERSPEQDPAAVELNQLSAEAMTKRRRESSLAQMLDHVYQTMDGSEASEQYSHRHRINSAAILTVYDDETAGLVADYLAPRIEGRTVVEIGGGIGLLAFHLGRYAKRVYCIEANPAWAWTFVGCLYASKPKNVSYLFGAADEFIGRIRGNVALFCTHSDVAGMRRAGERFADEVIDVWDEIIKVDPTKFDRLAVKLREFA